MRPRVTVPRSLMTLAGFQDGVVTRRQALNAGLLGDAVKGLVRTGRWTPVSRGMYAVEGTGGVGWEQMLWAGVLIGGPGSAVGGRAAAHLAGLAPRPEKIDIWAPRDQAYRQSPACDPWIFHRGRRTSRGSPPHLSVEETLLDLCADSDADGIGSWLARGITERRTTGDRLMNTLRGSPCLPNRRLIAECLSMVATGSNSPLEIRYRRDVEHAHGLPSGIRQRSVSDGTSSDVVYEEYTTIAELDGQQGHRGSGETRDAWRDSKHLVLGFVTLRFGWADVAGRPCQVAARVAEVLRTRGWTGEPMPCRRCRD